MLVKDCISKEIPMLKKSDSIEYALTLMDECKVKQLPLVDDNLYQSLVSERELMAMADAQSAIGESVLFAPALKEDGHLYEALALITRLGLSVLPVVSVEGLYLGAITRDLLVDKLAELCNAEAAGSVIVIELLPQDYALSDIARIVESNNAHVLSLFSSQDKDTGRLQLSIKIDLEDASPVIRSFERFNYTVLYHFMEKGMVDDLLRQRMNELIYYMNM